MCSYLTYTDAEYQVRSVPIERTEGPKQLDSGALTSIVFEALLPFPEAAAAVLSLVNKRFGTEVPI